MAGPMTGSFASIARSKASSEASAGPLGRRALGGGEVEHHHAVHVVRRLEPLQVVDDGGDGGAVAGRLALVGAVDVAAEGAAADRRPGAHLGERRRHVVELVVVEHPVLRRGGGEVGAVQVPAAEDEVLVLGEPVHRHARQRQAIEAVRAALEHLDPGRGGGGDSAPHANDRNSQLAAGPRHHACNWLVRCGARA